MSLPSLDVVFFCLATGATMGMAFVAFRCLGALLGLKKLGSALLDALFGCLCGGFVFLCALAVDSGRLRLYQAALQGLGGWCAASALGPGARKACAALKKIFCKVRGLLRGWKGILKGHFPARREAAASPGEKPRKKPKKQRKRT